MTPLAVLLFAISALGAPFAVWAYVTDVRPAHRRRWFR